MKSYNGMTDPTMIKDIPNLKVEDVAIAVAPRAA